MGRRRLPAPLATLLAAWLLVSTARWAFMVALSVYAFGRSGAGGVAAVSAARLLPSVLAAPVMGHLIDRVDRGRVVALSCGAQAVCTGGAAALAGGGAGLPWIVVLTVLIAIAATAPRPALQALMPALAAAPEQLSRATAVWSAVDNGGFLMGAGVGGLAITAFGTASVLSASAVMLALAALLAGGLPAVRATAPDAGTDVEEGFADALVGLRAVLRTPVLHVPYALFAGMLVLEGTSDVQLVALALGKLDMGSGGPGILFAVWGVGGIAGSALIAVLVRRRGYGLALVTGAIVLGAGLAAAGLDGVALAVITMVPAGVGFALVETAILGLVPRLADDAVIGRVYGLSELVYAGAAGVGALIAPALISALGVAGSMAFVGGALATGAVGGWAAGARIDVGQEQAARIRGLLRGIRFLAPLPLPRLERLVQAAHSLVAPAGSDIVRIGERGEEFFVIDQGALDVVEFGRRLGPGEGFGEIALLRDVPRTATVRAASEVHLWSVGRPAFIGAVTEHREARQMADAVIAESLAHPRLEVD